MKCLFVSLEMDSTAPGIVFKTLLNSLAEDGMDVHVLCPNPDRDFLSGKITFLSCPPIHISWRSASRRWRLFSCDPRDLLWARRCLIRLRKRICDEHYDAVVTLVSNGLYASLDLSRLISKSCGLKWLVYSVDGLPCPLVWFEQNPKIHRSLCKHIDEVCASADSFLSSNDDMLRYQMSVMTSFKGATGVAYTPWMPLGREFKPASHDNFTILYAGSLYGLRKIDGLLEGFRKFLESDSSARLVFVGEVQPSYMKLCPDLCENGSVQFLPYSKDIQSYYEKADVLLDIAADIPDDVYLSSKIVSYMPVPLPVVAISGSNSPCRKLMDTASVFHCSNDGTQIATALKAARDCTDFSDRAALLEIFSSRSQSDILKRAIEAL